MRILILLIIFIVLPLSAQEIYRWKDAKGRVHYGEAAPESGEYEQLTDDVLPHVHSSVPVHISKISRSKASSQNMRESNSRQRIVTHTNRENRQRSSDAQCDMYRRQLESIQRQLRAGYKEPKGNRLRAARRQIEDTMRKEC